jgi:membrane-associated protein
MLALNLLDAKALIGQAGTIGVLAIIFAETGLLIGFFFPGDSMLILAGVAASSAAPKVFGSGVQMPIAALAVGAPVCAILGAQLGHLLGARAGRRMFDRPNSRIFKREYVDKAELYFTKFGPAKAVVLARFIPVVRTFLNPVAGMLEMPGRRFFAWNVLGGVLWTEAMLMVGYVFGGSLADVIDKYMIPAVLLIAVLSALPILIEMLRGRREQGNGGGAPAQAGDSAAGVPAPRRPVSADRGGRHRRR